MAITDEEVLRAKYAEVAALKKAIDARKHAPRILKVPSGLNSLPPRPIGRVRKSRPIRRHQNLSLVMLELQKDNNNCNNTNQNAYIHTITGGGNSVMSVEQYERTKMAQEIHQREQQDRSRQQRLFYKQQSMVKKNMQDTEGDDRVRINGIVYAVTRRGAKLVLLSVPNPWKGEGSERWNGDTYIRQVCGDLYRLSKDRVRSTVDLCRYFASTGMCLKGSGCPFLHKETHLRLCKSVGKHYRCHDQCLFSHTPTQYNTPLCRFFLQGSCSNQNCIYLHRNPSCDPGACTGSVTGNPRINVGNVDAKVLVCRPFAYLGVCERGKLCPFLHLFRCADFEERGMCPRGKQCPLEHVYTRQVQQNMLTGALEETLQAEVVVKGTNDAEKSISSFTVDPQLLFVRPKDSYELYIDTEPRPEQGESEFMILLHSDSEDEDIEDSRLDVEENDLKNEDQLKDNNSFVGVGET